MSFARTISRDLAPLSRRFSTWDNIVRPEGKLEKLWFQEDEKLVKQLKGQQEKNSLHTIIFEGPCGSGKHEIVHRLSKLKYATSAYHFQQAFQQTPHKEDDFDLEEATAKQMKEIEDFIRNTTAKHKSGEIQVKDNILFVVRSPVTPYMSWKKPSPTYTRDRVLQFKKDNSCSIIACRTDFQIIQERVGGRLVFASDEEKKIREFLEEDDTENLKRLTDKYLELEKDEDIIDAVLHTTSTKQASTAILRMLGLGFSFKFPSQGGS